MNAPLIPVSMLESAETWQVDNDRNHSEYEILGFPTMHVTTNKEIVKKCLFCTILSQVGRYECACQSGWGGDLCEIQVDECDSSPCQNGAPCQDREGEYYCLCPNGFTGLYHHGIVIYMYSVCVL